MKKRKNDLKYRMYGLVPYNISEMQKGVQFAHAVIEYSNKYGSNDDYKKWVQHNRDFVILNGGSTNKNVSLKTGLPKGLLNKYVLKFSKKFIDVPYVSFYDPELGDQLTAFVFLVDERVWNKKKYPNFTYDDDEREFIGKQRSYTEQYHDWKMNLSDNKKKSNNIIKLRKFLKKIKNKKI